MWPQRATVLQDRPERPLPSWVSWAFIAIMLVPVGICAVRPELVTVAFCLVATLAALAAFIGTRKNTPNGSLPWRLLAIGPVSSVLGAVLTSTVEKDGTFQSVILPNLATAPSYICYTLAFALLLHRRRGTDSETIVDTLLVVIASAFILGSFLVLPYATGTPVEALNLVLLAVFPAMCLVVLFVMVILSQHTTHLPVFWILLAASLCVAFGDILFLGSVAGAWETTPAGDYGPYFVFYILASAGLLHPSIREFAAVPSATREEPYHFGRFVAVLVALVSPTVVVALSPLDTKAEQVLLIVALTVLALLVFFRVIWAVNDHARTEVLLHHDASHDSLTNLPNRATLEELLQEALVKARVSRKGVGVLFLDLDRFKAVNDTWGHAVGDDLLREVARRLQGVVRPGEHPTRVSGDEFVVVASGLRSVQEAVGVGHRVLSVFAEPFVLSDAITINMSPSVGVSYAVPSQGLIGGDTLIREADMAMYRSKSNPLRPVTLYDESMKKESQALEEMESDLRSAIDLDQMSVLYQPIIALSSGTATGFEAFLAWNHPELGMVAPETFVPIAEETLLILPLGHWIIDQAVAQLSVWQGLQDSQDAPYTVSVNLSPRQLHDPDLVQVVRRALHTHKVAARTLCLEITESAMFEDVDLASETLVELKKLGVTIAADDFGTGYSSLAYLQKFPVDRLKIDSSFVSQLGESPDADAIVTGIISLAGALGLPVTAEGVETPQQRSSLTEAGCDSAQGYLFARPMSVESVTLTLRPGRPVTALRSA